LFVSFAVGSCGHCWSLPTQPRALRTILDWRNRIAPTLFASRISWALAASASALNYRERLLLRSLSWRPSPIVACLDWMFRKRITSSNNPAPSQHKDAVGTAVADKHRSI
jgi:hypothetical protein